MPGVENGKVARKGGGKRGVPRINVALYFCSGIIEPPRVEGHKRRKFFRGPRSPDPDVGGISIRRAMGFPKDFPAPGTPF